MAQIRSVRDILKSASDAGRPALLELEVKAALLQSGISVPPGLLACSPGAAMEAAEELGYPVAVKISSPDIVHKTDVGGVILNLKTREEVARAYDQVTARAREVRPGVEFREVLVERMSPLGTELIVGAFREPRLGPVVMCGLGGIFVEVLRDVSFRVAPISARDAREMWSELAAAPILKGTRGKPPLDTGALERLLLAVAGEGGLLEMVGDAFSELDLNPLFLYPEGLSVVDARLLLRPEGNVTTKAPRHQDDEDKVPAAYATQLPTQNQESATLHSSLITHHSSLVDLSLITHHSSLAEVMRAVFEPASVAVIGASPDPHKLGNRIVRNLVDYGFRGILYPVHPKAAEICGVRAYPSLAEIPGPVERAIVAVGAEPAAQVIGECAEKGVIAAQIYAAGFGELNEHGAFLEKELLERARGRVRLVGPNCFGTYSPVSRMTMISGVPEEAGSIGFASQSGGLTLDAVRRGGAMGLRYRKAISIGNSIDLGPSDFLWEFGRDEDVRLIGMYLESARDGRRFASLLKEVGPRKPVVILKGGMTGTGARAAASHTGAVASDAAVWRGLFRQAGVSLVNSVEELFDTLLAFQMLSLPSGPRVALIGPGGGASVVATDAAERSGLEVGPFDPSTVRALRSLGLPPGTSLSNPLDIPAIVLRLEDGKLLGNLLARVVGDPSIDMMLVHLNAVSIFGEAASAEVAASHIENMVSAVLRLREETSRPVGLVLRWAADEEQERVVRIQRTRAIAAGVPVFSTLDMGLAALGHLRRYACFREDRGD